MLVQIGRSNTLEKELRAYERVPAQKDTEILLLKKAVRELVAGYRHSATRFLAN